MSVGISAIADLGKTYSLLPKLNFRRCAAASAPPGRMATCSAAGPLVDGLCVSGPHLIGDQGIKDIQRAAGLFASAGMHSHDSIIIAGSHFPELNLPDVTKAELMDRIRALFNSECHGHILYFSGHGRQGNPKAKCSARGAWVIGVERHEYLDMRDFGTENPDNFVMLEVGCCFVPALVQLRMSCEQLLNPWGFGGQELVKLWDERAADRRSAVLTIVSDCCYVPKMQELLADMKAAKDKRTASVVLYRCPMTDAQLLTSFIKRAHHFAMSVRDDWWREDGNISDLLG